MIILISIILGIKVYSAANYKIQVTVTLFKMNKNFNKKRVLKLKITITKDIMIYYVLYWLRSV